MSSDAFPLSKQNLIILMAEQKAGEELLKKYQKKQEHLYIFIVSQNLYGKWSQPNYNTVVATFCYKIARGRRSDSK